MWPRDYQQRLTSWTRTRIMCETLPLHQALAAINDWWFAAPWVAYTLHWDDRRNWPDPWQLMEESRLCSLARGLGMLYTVALLERADIHTACLAETDRDNLVLIDGEKYILNWSPEAIVNINPGTIKHSRHQFTLVEAQQQIR